MLSKSNATLDRANRCAPRVIGARGALSRLLDLSNLSKQASVVVVVMTAMAATQITQAQTAPATNQLPQGGSVTAGDAQINQSGNVMNIDQSSQKAIINWNEFNVGEDATVNFNQPGSDAATLNRVLDSNASQIFGRIVAPGQVILINPNGAYFAPSASVDVGGLIATTHELADKDFLDGNYQFTRNGATGEIINEGELKAKLDGYIALMAPEVRNQGVIIAERGTVALASGEHIQLDFGTGNKLQGITVTEQDLDAQIENRHAIFAEGGLVILSARATAELRASVIKNSGQIVASAGANTVTEKGGRIILEGNTIEVTEGSELLATGPKGGGDILIGGDWQGGANEERRVLKEPDAMHEATTVTVETNTKIDASATDNGDGGTVVVWSDVKNPDSVTTAQGEILAKGGENGGDGGQIETSGASLIVDDAIVSAGAPKGLGGEWLLDPYDWEIGPQNASRISAALNEGISVTIITTFKTLPDPTIGDTVGILQNQDTTNSSAPTQYGDITVSAPISKTDGGEATLTLRAHRRVNVNNDIGSTVGKLNVVLWSDYDNNNDGGSTISGSGSVSTNGGHLWMGGSSSFEGTYTWNGLTVGDGPSVGSNVSNRNAVDLYGSVTTSGGDVLIWAGDGYDAGTNGINTNSVGSVDAAAGNVTLITDTTSGSFPVTTTGTLSLLPNDGSYAETLTIGGETSSGDLTLNTSHYNGMVINDLANLTGLNIGRFDSMRNGATPVVLGNTSNVTIATVLAIAGPISIVGNHIIINESLETTVSDSDILIQSNGPNGVNGYISLASGKDLTTSGGDIILWSNTANLTSGTANNEIILAGSNDLTSNGGNIVLAGGLDDGGNGGVENDGIPDGFAYRAGYTEPAVDIRANVSLISDGGDVIIRGQGNSDQNRNLGIGTGDDFLINSGTGTITVHGKNLNNAVDMAGGNFVITSASTAATAISITAESVKNAGLIVNFNANTGDSLIQTTGVNGGGILITGNSDATGQNGLWLGENDTGGGTLQILSNGGDISLISNQKIYLRNQDVYLGNRKDATAVNGITPVPTTSSSNVLIRTDYVDESTGSDFIVSTTGSLTIEPYSNAWTEAFMGGAGATRLDLSGVLSGDNFTGSGEADWLEVKGVSGLTGFTLGKPSMTSNFITNTAWEINGPIEFYGNTIEINGDLRTTAAGAGVLVKGSGNVVLSAGKSVTSAGTIAVYGGAITTRALTADGKITLIASDTDVLVNGAIQSNSNSANELDVQANRHIRLGTNGTIASSNAALDVSLWADTDADGDGILYVESESIATNGGDLTFGKQGQAATIAGASVLVGGDVFFQRTASAQSLTTGGGELNIYGETIVANTAGLTINSGDGDITLHGLLNSGNSYASVSGARTWDEARNDADNVADSYLATITSRLENAIASLTVDYEEAWLGGRRLIGTNLWQWVTDPTYNVSTNPLTFFYQGTDTQTELGGSASGSGGTTATGYYANWNGWTDGQTTGEPNNYLGANFSVDSESALRLWGTQGFWNDVPFNSGTLNLYVRETTLAGSPVTINAGTGTLTINGGVGTSKAFASLDVTSSATMVTGNGIVTTGAQTYSSALSLNSTGSTERVTLASGNGIDGISVGGNAAVYGATIDLKGTLDASGNDIVFEAVNPAEFFGRAVVFSPDAELKTSGTGTINITGDALNSTRSSGSAWGVTFGGSNLIQSENGAITITGRGGSAADNSRGIVSDNRDFKVLSSAGDITLNDTKPKDSYAGLYLRPASNGGIVFGSDGTTLLSGSSTDSSSNITISADRATFDINKTIIATTGEVKVEPVGSSFTAGLDARKLQISDGPSSVVIGKTTNTAEVSVGAVTANGPISVYGGNITANENINTTGGAADGDVLLKSSGDIILSAGKSITTSGGSVILWANSDNQTSNGSIALRDGSSIVTGSSSVAGGAIWIGGGSDGGSWNGLSVGDGYAVPGTAFTPSDGGNNVTAGIYLEQNTLSSFGGNIKIAGDAAASFAGILTYGDTVSINADSGAIEMDGQANGATGDRNGIFFGIHDLSVAPIVNISSSATGDAIKLNGVGRGNGDAIAVSGTVTLTASGGGNISLDGNALGTGRSIVAGSYYHGKLNVYANSGDITLNGNTKAVAVVAAVNTSGLTSGPSKLNIGQGGDITSSSSNVTITGDQISIAAGGIAVNSTGQLAVEPFSTSFSAALSWPVTNFSVGSSLTGLRLGKEGNAANVTVTSAQTIAGPISVYGGLVTLNSGLTTTNASTGNVSIVTTGLSGSGGVSLATGRSLTVTQSGDSTYSGNISGTGSTFVKQGAGTLTLSGTSTYAGGSTVESGVIKLGASTSGTVSSGPLGTGLVTVEDGAAIDVNGKTLPNAMNITGTGVSSSGVVFNSGTAATLSGAITLAGDSTIDADAAALTVSGSINGAHDLTVNASNANYTQSGIVGGTAPLTAYTIATGTGLVQFDDAVEVDGAMLVNNSGGVTVNSAIDVSGDLTFNAIQSGADIVITGSGSIVKTSGTDATLTFKTDNIELQSGSSITSTNNRLNVIFWAEQPAAGGGDITLDGATIDTNGGGIVMAGGDSTANWVPYAGGSALTIPDGTPYGDGAGVLVKDSTITTAGGNLRSKGRTINNTGVDDNFGVHITGSTIQTAAGNQYWFGNYGKDGMPRADYLSAVEINNATLSATTGDIEIAGEIQTSGSVVNGNALRIGSLGGSDNTVATGNVSITTTTGDITLTGDQKTAGVSSTGFGYGLSLVTLGTDTVTIESQGGGITLTGNASSTVGTDRGIHIHGATADGLTIDANGGAIDVTGSFPTGAGAGQIDHGIHTTNLNVLNSGAGGITVTGNATNSASTGAVRGITFESTRIQTDSGAIDITGTAGKASGNSRGITVENNTLQVLSASGAITVTDQAPVGLTGNYNGLYLAASANNGIVFGADGVDVPSSSSAVTVLADKISVTSANTSRVNTAGAVVVESVGTTFTSAVDLSKLSLDGGPSSVRIGKTNNTGNVTAGAVTAAGPVTIYGGDIIINQDLTSTVSSEAILLKASRNIVIDTANIRTTAGDVTLWANSADNDDGMVFLDDATIETSGGHLWIGGGAQSATAWNGLTVGDGYAVGNATLSNGISLRTTTINAAGGNIAFYGKSLEGSQTSDSFDYGTYMKGIRLQGGNTIDSGAGTIYLKGIARGTTGATNGIEFSNPGNDRIQSANTTVDAIYIDGEATSNPANVSNAWGVYTWNAVIQATEAGGGITIKGSGTRNDGVRVHTTSSVLAQSGPITLIGTGYGSGANAVGIEGTVGQKADSDVAASSSDVTVRGDTFGGSGTIDTAGQVIFEPYNASFAANVNVPTALYSSNITGLIIGKAGNTKGVTVGSAVTVAGPITIYSDDINVEAALEATSSRISFVGAAADDLNGTVANLSAGSITADELLIQNIHNVTLRSHANVSVDTFASAGGYRILLENDKALTIGTVGGVNGVSVSDWAIIETTEGDLNVNQNITSAGTGSSAVYLTAGKNTAAGTASGGDIKVANGVSVTTGAGGRARFFTGSLTGSTRVAESADGANDGLVEYGSGNFRYNADEGTDFSSGNWTNLGTSGIYAIYREQPRLSGTIKSETMTYGDGLPTFSLSGGTDPVNGDTVVVAIQLPSYSTANELEVGTYAVTQTNLAGLGYDVGSITGGELVVSKLLLTGTIANGSSVYGASLNPSGVTFTNVVGSDVLGTPTVSVDTTGNVSSSSNLKAGTYTGIQSITALSGTDAGNYDFTGVLGDYTVSKLALTGSIANSSSVYGDALLTGALTLDNAMSGDVLNSAVSIDTTGNTSRSGNLKYGSYSGIQSVTSLGGDDAANYTFADITAGDYSVGQRTLTVEFSAANKVYDGNTSATVTANDNRVTDDAFVVNRTVAFDNKNVGTNKTVNITSISLTGDDAANYNVIGSTTDLADIEQLASATWIGTANGNWSDASNWAVTGNLSQTGVLPDGGNVAMAVIPSTYSNTLTSDTNHGHSGQVDIQGGALVIESDTPTTSVSSFGGAGQLRIESVGTSFSSAFNTTDWTFASDLGSLVIGRASNTSDVTLGSTTTIAGSITVYGGDVTLATGLTAGADNDIVISATENFINTVGANVLSVTGDGRWVVYAGNARGNTYGDLDSDNTAVWNASADTLPVASVPAGNRYVFDQDPIRTVIVTTTDAAKTYGEAIDVSGNYVIASPGIPGVVGAYLGVEEVTSLTMADVFTQGGVFDPALVSALQTEASALVGTGTTDITLEAGTENVLYDVTYDSAGKLTINRRPITLVADAFSITYGDAEPTLSVSMTAGSVATAIGDTLADVTGELMRTGAGTTNAGVYDIILGSGANAGAKAENYAITFEPDNNAAEIDKARLSLVGNKVYDGSILLDAADLTVTGVNGETFVDSGNVVMGTKNVQSAEPLGSLQGLTLTDGTGLLSNYEALVLSDTSVSVTARPVMLSAAQTTKTYDGTLLYEMNAGDLSSLSANLVGGDSVVSADLTFNSKDVSRDGNGNVLSNRVVTLSNIEIDDGNAGGNYQVTIVDATDGRIDPAPLRITAVNDAKFVTQADPSGYMGAIYNGFVGGEDASTAGLFSQVGQVTRSNAGTESAGKYADVLVAAGWEANNYAITHEAGDFTIVPADTLLVRAPALNSTYSEALPEFNTVTAQYLDSGDNEIKSLAVLYDSTSNLYSVDDGAGSTATFAFAIDDAPLSSSGFAQAGGYNVAADANTTFSGQNFQDLVMVGALTVAPKTLANDLGIDEVSKVYDGNRSVTGLDLNFDGMTAGVVSEDLVSLVGNGAYADRNVGTNKAVQMSLALRGEDANNYRLSTPNYSANVGTITQRESVTWIGQAGGSWSDSRNWEDGALPDGNNVANVVIPQGAEAFYNSDLVGVTTSTIDNDGTIRFASNNPFTLSNAISGTGNIEQRGAGLLTMAGDSTFTGTTDIGGRALTVASSDGLGAGNLVSNGGRLVVADGVTLAGLTVQGPIGLYSNVASTGDQTYNGAVTMATGSLASPLNIASTNGDLTFNGTISAGQGSKAAQRSLTLQGERVTIADQVGLAVKDMLFGNYQGTQDTNPYSLRVVGDDIYLLADVTTFESQRYEGAVFIGDNGSNGFSRTLISLDPSVTFTDTVDAVTDGVHGLDVRAYTLASNLNEVPRIDFEGAVGQSRALLSLFADVGLQNPSTSALVATPIPNLPPVVGQVTLADNVNTIGSQTYRGNSVTLGRAGQTITLDARSGTVDVIAGRGANAGVVGLDRLRLAFGDFTEPGQGLSRLLADAGINSNQIIARTGFFADAAKSPTGAFAGVLGSRLVTQQRSDTNSQSPETQAGQSTVLMDAEVEVGALDSVVCGDEASADAPECE